jgi:hypothetical protein
MIKAKLTGPDGRPIVLLGLSELNVGELRKRKPIMVDLGPFGIEGQVVVMWGETEEAIAQELAQHFKLPA